jgi:hypothetical protein
MPWFYEAFFPVVWISFFLYWQIKALTPKSRAGWSRLLRAFCAS